MTFCNDGLAKNTVNADNALLSGSSIISKKKLDY
jgi:hypothetical protein